MERSTPLNSSEMIRPSYLKAGDTGAFIGKPDLSKAPSLSKHSTYNTQIYGDYVGGLLDSVPQEVLWKKSSSVKFMISINQFWAR